MDSGLFLPGWGAPATLYTPGLPRSWDVLEPPSFAASGGSLAPYSRWLELELRRRGRSSLAGHSMGGALAIVAAANTPELVERLVLIAPAGLPLDKPIRHSLGDFVGQLVRGNYPRRVAIAAVLGLARAPRSAYAVAQHLRALDLRCECERVRSAGIPTTVIGCVTDTLVTTDRTRALAWTLGARYRQLELPGGHMWMLTDPHVFAAAVSG
jgi:pimeloyl-ACP methyl ester carboxylesterase